MGRRRGLPGGRSRRLLRLANFVRTGGLLGRRAVGLRHGSTSTCHTGEERLPCLVNYGLSMTRRQALTCKPIFPDKDPLHQFNEDNIKHGKAAYQNPIKKKQGLGME